MPPYLQCMCVVEINTSAIQKNDEKTLIVEVRDFNDIPNNRQSRG